MSRPDDGLGVFALWPSAAEYRQQQERHAAARANPRHRRVPDRNGGGRLSKPLRLWYFGLPAGVAVADEGRQGDATTCCG